VETVPPPSPTPEWSADEQAAIDAVHAYIELSNYVAQNLDTADWNAIYDVAADPAAGRSLDLWTRLANAGLIQVGWASFTVDRAETRMTDHSGQHFYVTGCFDASAVYMTDSTGVEMSRSERASFPTNFSVLHATDGAYVVIEDTVGEGTC
jgi:hypothetical protein